MARYILIENHSGYVWGEADAADPIEACRIVDEHVGGELREYAEAFYVDTSRNAYHVHQAPADWRPVDDGQSQSEIERVAALPRVALVTFRKVKNSN